MHLIDNTTKRKKDAEELLALIRKDMEEVGEVLPDMAGYAIVVWNDEFESASAWSAEKSKLPGILVPDFVREALKKKQNLIQANDIIDERFDYHE